MKKMIHILAIHMVKTITCLVDIVVMDSFMCPGCVFFALSQKAQFIVSSPAVFVFFHGGRAESCSAMLSSECAVQRDG